MVVFGRQLLFRSMEPLVDGPDRAAENLGNLGMRQLFPGGEPYQLPIPGLQPRQRLERTVELGPADNDFLWCRDRWVDDRGPKQQTAEPRSAPPVAVYDPPRHGVEPGARRLVVGNIVDATPGNLECLLAAAKPSAVTTRRRQYARTSWKYNSYSRSNRFSSVGTVASTSQSRPALLPLMSPAGDAPDAKRDGWMNTVDQPEGRRRRRDRQPLRKRYSPVVRCSSGGSWSQPGPTGRRSEVDLTSPG